MVRGTPCHSESNGGIERSNRTVEDRLGALMDQYKCNCWSILCKLVQWCNNTSVHTAIGDIPYRSLTGQNPSVGISSLPLSKKTAQ